LQRLAKEHIRDAKHVLVRMSKSKTEERIPFEQITSITAAAISYAGPGAGKYETTVKTLLRLHEIDGHKTDKHTQWWPVVGITFNDAVVKHVEKLEMEIVPKGDGSDDESPCVGDEIEVSAENFVAYRKMKVPRIMVSCIYQLIDKQPQVWSVGVRMKVKEVAAESAAPPTPHVEMC
jgi:hypothetical protein